MIEKVKRVELIYVDEYMIMAVIIFENRVVKTRKILLTSPIYKDELDTLAQEINELIKDRNVGLQRD